ncbi:MAG: DUF5667 domain-containing protein [Dehalococcoidales bacterium]|nr:DUF5667 domain-containing protein [Dehalococcoidales bacterium]
MNSTREFDNILNECLERILLKGESIEQCLAGHPGIAGELKPLLETAIAAKQATAVKPRAEFREKTRRQFQNAVYETVEKRAHRSLFSWHPQWATTVAAVLIVVLLGGGGTVAAASNSLPDETLYPVKIATEQVRLVLTPTAMGKADLYVKLTDKRVSEIEAMAARGNPHHIEVASERMNEHLAAIAMLRGTRVAMPMGMMAPAPQMLTSSNESADTAAPARTAPNFAPAPAPVTGIAPPVAVAPRVKVPADNETLNKELDKLDRETRLKVIIARRAIENREALLAMLERAPEHVKPALQRALAQSEEGYQNALKALDKEE